MQKIQYFGKYKCTQIAMILYFFFQNVHNPGAWPSSSLDEHSFVVNVYARINKKSLKDFQKVEGFFSPNKKDVVIDFGCGTGKTTVAMAKGEFVSEKSYHVTILYYYIKLQIHRKKWKVLWFFTL